jgi:hypothetical protein
MKKVLVAGVFGLTMVLGLSTAWSASQIDGKVTNQSQVEQAANIAIGEDNKARMGSISMKDSSVGKTGQVTNQSQVKQAANIAIGKGNEANMGSISMKGTPRSTGKLTNTVAGEAGGQHRHRREQQGQHGLGQHDRRLDRQDRCRHQPEHGEQAANIAIGKGNEANMGSINMQNAKVEAGGQHLTNTWARSRSKTGSAPTSPSANIAIEGQQGQHGLGQHVRRRPSQQDRCRSPTRAR